MSRVPGEFDGIFVVVGQQKPMSPPPTPLASVKFVREVKDALGLDDDAAPAAADWVVGKLHRFLAIDAQPVFDMEGQGPLCSACFMFWPLCGHHVLSEWSPDADEEDEAGSDG
ncbi:hypothetical protein [Mycetocola saprophilus]|uniref:hypothetical protein n=1 Tax=Mycetocola saprophilus TaxID=76636 RepID=UPI0004C20AF0|nr:hypothetical protein [Mycetocola saprophilus]